MKILIFCLPIVLFCSCDSFAQTCSELFTLSSNQYSISKNDIFVDSEFGVLKIVNFDFQNDVLEVVRMDPDRARQSGGYNSHLPIKIAPFLKRKFAKIPSTESSQIVKDRVSSSYSFAALKYYFALYRIIDLMAGNKSKFKFKEQFLDQLSADTLNSWTFKIFERKLPKGLDDLIAQIEGVTGENLVQSGILSTLALRSKWRNDRLAWPASAGKKANVFQRVDGKRHNVEVSIEMDIDHFARAYLWKNSAPAILPTISKEDFDRSISEEFRLNTKSSLDKVFVVEIEGELSRTANFNDSILNFSKKQERAPFDDSPFWRDLLQVAESPMKINDVNGQRVAFFISKRIPNIDVVAAHLRQLAWINGATSVSLFRVD